MSKTHDKAKKPGEAPLPEPVAAATPAGAAPTAEPPGDAPPAVATPTPEQLQDLKQKASKAEEHWDRFVRLTADFDNFKKRAAREKQDAIRFANEGLLEKLMPVLDNFDMALAAVQTAQNAAPDSLQTGVNMILQQFKGVLKEAGLEEIEAAGQVFDPNLHEAVAQRESADVQEGHVVQQLRRGYKLRERLLRPASVIVAKPPGT